MIICLITRSITMLWVALGHFYMYGVFYGIFDTEPLRNRGDAEKVNLLRVAIQKYYAYEYTYLNLSITLFWRLLLVKLETTIS